VKKYPDWRVIGVIAKKLPVKNGTHILEIVFLINYKLYC